MSDHASSLVNVAVSTLDQIHDVSGHSCKQELNSTGLQQKWYVGNYLFHYPEKEGKTAFTQEKGNLSITYE